MGKDEIARVDKLFDKFVQLRKSGRSKCVKDASIANTFKSLKFRNNDNSSKINYKSTSIIALLLVVIAVLLTKTVYFNDLMYDYVYGSKCLLDNNALIMEASRPLMYCNMCENIKSVPVTYDISKEEFVSKYAYSGVPVLIKESTRNWTALDTFSFPYLRNMYLDTPGALDEEDCQFFPYKTNFKVLRDAFEMSEERASLEPGEDTWYFGWSNCHPSVGQKLRRHYQRPYFLPDNAESSVTDWIFMGWSGLGAFLHIDYVQRPSWQAQISGRKQWKLVPPPECEHVCTTMNVTVEKGDIFVIDTNLWYHETTVQPGALSIAIGSEYD